MFTGFVSDLAPKKSFFALGLSYPIWQASYQLPFEKGNK